MQGRYRRQPIPTRSRPIPRWPRRARTLGLLIAPVLGAALSAQPSVAAPAPKLPAIRLTYRGGSLLQNVNVSTLYWGSNWTRSTLTGYFNSFFSNLFSDGRFMANLAQYSAGGSTIGSGSFAGTDTDTQSPGSKVTDDQIRAEILAQVAAGSLPAPDQNTIYFVFTPPGSVVYDNQGNNSLQDFVSYHDYDFDSPSFAYAVVPYDSSLQDPRLMTLYASHELAEAVTDPEPYDNTLGWYDDNYGEIADIPVTLYNDNQLTVDEIVDELDASDGTPYLVQKSWSLQDNAPVAFATSG